MEETPSAHDFVTEKQAALFMRGCLMNTLRDQNTKNFALSFGFKTNPPEALMHPIQHDGAVRIRLGGKTFTLTAKAD